MPCYLRVQTARYLGMSVHEPIDDEPFLRVGQAAEILGVTVETIRRWETEGRLTMTRSAGGQRLVALADVTRLLAERRRAGPERPTVGGSARNRFRGDRHAHRGGPRRGRRRDPGRDRIGSSA